MRFTVETAGESAAFDGSVQFGNNRATIDASPGTQAKIVEFLCSAHGIKDGYGDVEFDVVLQTGDRLGGCVITRRGRDLGLMYMRGPR